MTTRNEIRTINAQEFANSIDFPIVFIAGVGCPGGQSIALLEGTELPFDLSSVEGVLREDGILEANNLTAGPGAHDWKFVDWNRNTIYKIQVFSDEATWNSQNDE